jgi:hypothetical protein
LFRTVLQVELEVLVARQLQQQMLLHRLVPVQVLPLEQVRVPVQVLPLLEQLQ